MTRVEALKLIKSDGIYSQEVMDALQEPFNANQHNSNALNDVEQHTNALERDAISRQAVIKNQKIVYQEYCKTDNEKALMEELARLNNELPSVNLQEPCEDCISRAEAIKALNYKQFIKVYGDFDKYITVIKDLLTNIYNTQRKAIEDLPSIQPKTGHCKDCKSFRKIPYHFDTCIQHRGLCPKGDWYCADYEPQESDNCN